MIYSPKSRVAVISRGRERKKIGLEPELCARWQLPSSRHPNARSHLTQYAHRHSISAFTAAFKEEPVMSETPASAASQPTRLTGAEIVWATLEGEGVREVFGYPGGAILPVYDALRKYPIRHILVRHEQSAAHAADGYARASGKVGVAVATSGPAATNLVTGIATAMMDSVPHGLHHRPDLLQAAGHRRLPGSGHHRHYAADHQAQLHRDPPGGHCPGAARGLPRGALRPPRPGAGGHHQGRAAGTGGFRFRRPPRRRRTVRTRCFRPSKTPSARPSS